MTHSYSFTSSRALHLSLVKVSGFPVPARSSLIPSLSSTRSYVNTSGIQVLARSSSSSSSSFSSSSSSSDFSSDTSSSSSSSSSSFSRLASLFSSLQLSDKSANRVSPHTTRSGLPILIKSANKTSPVLPERNPRSLPANVTPSTAAAVTAKIEQRRQRVLTDLIAARKGKVSRNSPNPGPSILKTLSKPGRVVPFPPHVRPSSPEFSRQRACTRKYDSVTPISMTVAEEATHPPSRIPYYRVYNWLGRADLEIVPYQLSRGNKPYRFCHPADKDWFWAWSIKDKDFILRRHEPRDWITTPAEADVDSDRPTKVRFADPVVTGILWPPVEDD